MWTCPKCDRPIKNPKQWHNCVKVDVDSLFTGKKAELTFVFDEILAQVADWEGVALSATQHCIVFVKRQTFLVIRPMQKELDLKFYLPAPVDHFPIHKSCAYAGKWEHHIRLKGLDELNDEVFRLLRMSYDLY